MIYWSCQEFIGRSLNRHRQVEARQASRRLSARFLLRPLPCTAAATGVCIRSAVSRRYQYFISIVIRHDSTTASVSLHVITDLHLVILNSCHSQFISINQVPLASTLRRNFYQKFYATFTIKLEKEFFRNN